MCNSTGWLHCLSFSFMKKDQNTSTFFFCRCCFHDCWIKRLRKALLTVAKLWSSLQKHLIFLGKQLERLTNSEPRNGWWSCGGFKISGISITYFSYHRYCRADIEKVERIKTNSLFRPNLKNACIRVDQVLMSYCRKINLKKFIAKRPKKLEFFIRL